MQNATTVKLKIKDWAESDRPREKLLRLGRKSLTDAELLAIILGSGSKTETALDLARRILQTCDNRLEKLARYSVKDMVRLFKGVGEAKAIAITACLELGLRRCSESTGDAPKVNSSNDAFQLFSSALADLETERFWVAYLNRSLHLIEKKEISHGGKTATIVDVQQIIKYAILCNATSMVLAHNHPSGACYPSESDKILTKKVKEAAILLDIQVIDHIIVAGKRFYSFADCGLM
jgi:DNA repair protein RadC